MASEILATTTGHPDLIMGEDDGDAPLVDQLGDVADLFGVADPVVTATSTASMTPSRIYTHDEHIITQCCK